jgi:hypothetical protein
MCQEEEEEEEEPEEEEPEEEEEEEEDLGHTTVSSRTSPVCGQNSSVTRMMSHKCGHTCHRLTFLLGQGIAQLCQPRLLPAPQAHAHGHTGCISVSTPHREPTPRPLSVVHQ